jgi:hypothetical protein
MREREKSMARKTIRKLTEIIKEKRKKAATVALPYLMGKTPVMVRFSKKELIHRDNFGWVVSQVNLHNTDVFITEVRNYGAGLANVTIANADGRTLTTHLISAKTKVLVLPKADQEKALKDNEDVIIKSISRMLGHNFTIGSDPEIFVEDKDGVVIPAFDFLGSKKEPSKTAGIAPRGDLPLYWDGFQAEFETHATTCLGFLTDSVQYGLRGLFKALQKHDPKGTVSSKVVMDIPDEMLRKAKNEHVQFGCMPSKNAYGLKGNQKDGRDVPFRPAGGHLHFGVGKKTKEQYEDMVKALDAIIGVACVSLFAKFDDPRRRTLYGLAGEYRTPPHGLEYRTLSNAWLFHPTIMNLVFDISRKALVFGEKGMLAKYWKTPEKDTIDCIMKSDVKAARKILKDNEKVFKRIVSAAYGEDPVTLDVVFNVFFNGMEAVIAKPTDIVSNWNLDGTWQDHNTGREKNFGKYITQISSGKKIS